MSAPAGSRLAYDGNISIELDLHGRVENDILNQRVDMLVVTNSTSQPLVLPPDSRVLWEYGDGGVEFGDIRTHHAYTEKGTFFLKATVFHSSGNATALIAVNVDEVFGLVTVAVCIGACCLLPWFLIMAGAFLWVRRWTARSASQPGLSNVTWERSDVVRLGLLGISSVFPPFYLGAILAPLGYLVWRVVGGLFVGMFEKFVGSAFSRKREKLSSMFFILDRKVEEPVQSGGNMLGHVMDRTALALNFSLAPVLLAFTVFMFLVDVPETADPTAAFFDTQVGLVIFLMPLLSVFLIPIRILADSAMVMFDRSDRRVEYVGHFLDRAIEPLVGLGAFSSFVLNFSDSLFRSGETLMGLLMTVYVIWGFGMVSFFIISYLYIPRHVILVRRLNAFLVGLGLVRIELTEMDGGLFSLHPVFPVPGVPAKPIPVPEPVPDSIQPGIQPPPPGQTLPPQESLPPLAPPAEPMVPDESLT